MNGLPWGDWQFWVVSAAALGAAILAWRNIVSRAVDGDAPCERCGVNIAGGDLPGATQKREAPSGPPAA